LIKLRRIRREGNVVCMRDMRNACKILVRKLEEIRLLGRCRYKWDNNIKVNLKETGCECVD
jgi:hypothetical protein